jgi:hypothetical protein
MRRNRKKPALKFSAAKRMGFFVHTFESLLKKVFSLVVITAHSHQISQYTVPVSVYKLTKRCRVALTMGVD